MPTTAPHLWSGLASFTDPLSLNPSFVFAAGRAPLCNLKQKSPCPQGLALLLHPPLAWTLQQHAEASGGGEGCAGPIAACCLPSVGDPQPVPPSWGPRRAQRLLLRSGAPGSKAPEGPLGTTGRRVPQLPLSLERPGLLGLLGLTSQQSSVWGPGLRVLRGDPAISLIFE